MRRDRGLDLGHQQPPPPNVGLKFRVPFRVHNIKAGAQHSAGGTVNAQGAAMRRGIHTTR